MHAGPATQLTFATGGTAGTYYPLGGAIAQVWNAKVPGLNVLVQATGASAENIRLINKKQVDLAFIQNDINHYAYNGIEVFKEKLPDFAVIASLYPETLQIVVAADGPIKSVADLKGKRVSVGAPGSGVEANARQVLSAFRLDYKKITPLFSPLPSRRTSLKTASSMPSLSWPEPRRRLSRMWPPSTRSESSVSTRRPWPS